MTGLQQGHRVDAIDNMGNVITFSVHVFNWVERVREVENSVGRQRKCVRDPTGFLASCCILLQSAIVIREAAAAILSYSCLADNP